MRKYKIELDELDLGQVLDGLETRIVAWENTAVYHRTGKSAPGMIIEECGDAEEAEKIAAHYRSIIGKLHEQREAQS